jgi:flagellar biosynthesis/type III secretory pathway chaperone
MTENNSALQVFIEQQLPLSQRLLQALQSEEQALISNDIDALEQATHEKNLVVNLFLTGQQQLLRQLQQKGLPLTQDNLTVWLEVQPNKPSQEARAIAKTLQTAAQEINSSNGLLIQRLSSRAQAGLSALRGQRDAGLYSPSGKNSQASSFRVIV